jgi:hypothetical protein
MYLKSCDKLVSSLSKTLRSSTFKLFLTFATKDAKEIESAKITQNLFMLGQPNPQLKQNNFQQRSGF